MKLAVCSCYVRGRFGEAASPDEAVRALEELAHLGFRRVELGATGPRQVRALCAAGDRFRFVAARHELDVFAVSVELAGIFSVDEAVRERAFEDFDLAVHTAVDLGATFVHMPVPAASSAAVESVAAAGQIAARYGRLLAIEPPAGSDTASVAAELIERAAEANVRAVLDLSVLEEAGADLTAALERLSDRVAYLRAADRNGHGRVHLAPGAGELDWMATFTVLAQHRYTGYVGLQIEEADPRQVREKFRSGAEYLHSIAERGGFLLE